MIFDPILDIFRGKAVTIPPMDGAIKPNTALDDAEAVLEAQQPDNLCPYRGGFVYSSANKVFAIEGNASQKEIGSFDEPVTALAVSPSSDLAIGLDNGDIGIMKSGGATTEIKTPGGLACPTALAFGASGELYVAEGSAKHRASDWVVDLMSGGSSGSVWRIDLDGGNAQSLAQGLAFPYGVLAPTESRGLVISESWRHRLVGIGGNGALEPILTKLPGYPARLSPAADGGAWLALFAPRNRLIEFVLLEKAYRTDMVSEVPREHWIAPSLSSESSFLEPLQCGGVKTMGIHKPWSPSRSYGLAVKLDAKLQPEASFHSRANGRRHGVTAVAESGSRVFAVSRGGGVILDVSVASKARS
jgi:hypothetical protein